jgi:transcription elongation factor GreA
MVGPVYLTESGKAALEAELHDLIHAQRPAVIARIKAAKELGDLRENADYEIARNEQSFIEGKILEIEEKLRNAEIIDESSSTDEIALGSTVTVTAERKSRDYLIVGSTEADPSGEPPKISNESPLGKALIGRKVGDKVVVTLPNGNEINYTVKKIS